MEVRGCVFGGEDLEGLQGQICAVGAGRLGYVDADKLDGTSFSFFG